MFPCGHKSLFSDSFPVLDHHLQRPPSKHSTTLDDSLLPPTTELISAVDIFYENNPIFSKVEETETITGWFQFPPFRIDLLDEKELVPTPISFVSESDDDILSKRLEEKLSTLAGSDRRWPWGWFSTTELVECEIMVTLGGREGRMGDVSERSDHAKEGHGWEEFVWEGQSHNFTQRYSEWEKKASQDQSRKKT
ncbi:hypothetical protein Q3G72_021675 [Acer saccharum]|nr:hypothetical protein Q3G72_021675 [Acer saccharum]